MARLPAIWTSTCCMNSRFTELRLAGAVFALLDVLFVAWPQLDIAASRLFFGADGQWFLYRGEPAVFRWLYLGIPPAGQSLLAILALGLLLGCLPRFVWLRSRRIILGFTLAAALVGPVLVVDAGLKNYWGRARPLTVEAFGGPRHFTPAFVISDQCPKNCSFASGHVATASFVMAFGWLASLGSGALLAVVRMSAGGHFLSDTIFAWFATYFSLWLTEWIFRRLGWLPAQSSQD